MPSKNAAIIQVRLKPDLSAAQRSDAIEQIRAGGSTSSIIANLRERLRRLEEERDAERAEARGQGGDGPATRPAS